MAFEELSSLFDPFTIWHILIIMGMGIAGFQIIIRASYARDPTSGRIGDFHMYMFHMVNPQKWKATLFRQDPLVTPALEKVFKEKGTTEIAEIFRKNQGKLFFYLARHMPMPTGTLTSGYSIIATNADLDHSDYHKTWEDHWLSFRGYSSRVRDVAQSGREGMLFPDKADVRIGKKLIKNANLIYYDAQPMVKNPTVDPAKVETVRCALGAVTQLMTWNKTAQDEENKNAVIKELQSAKKNAVGRAATMQAHYNESEWARFNKRPDQILGVEQRSSVNPYAAAGGVGLLMLIVTVALKDQAAQFDPLFGGLLALLIGLGGIYGASKLMGGSKPRV